MVPAQTCGSFEQHCFAEYHACVKGTTLPLLAYAYCSGEQSSGRPHNTSLL